MRPIATYDLVATLAQPPSPREEKLLRAIAADPGRTTSDYTLATGIDDGIRKALRDMQRKHLITNAGHYGRHPRWQITEAGTYILAHIDAGARIGRTNIVVLKEPQ